MSRRKACVGVELRNWSSQQHVSSITVQNVTACVTCKEFCELPSWFRCTQVTVVRQSSTDNVSCLKVEWHHDQSFQFEVRRQLHVVACVQDCAILPDSCLLSSSSTVHEFRTTGTLGQGTTVELVKCYKYLTPPRYVPWGDCILLPQYRGSILA